MPGGGRPSQPPATGLLPKRNAFNYSFGFRTSRSGQFPSGRAPPNGPPLCPDHPRSIPAHSGNGASALREERLIVQSGVRNGRTRVTTGEDNSLCR
ncbi:predicted protein [Streptomyces viridosporus ATCC 14672]|uniref:Predicted protein n=1 Tax=Streptomyces viridosporus (strain ATCC 14672 / DSM 40746 / JCM 4963 / KCTC 9882 / NRRL B-12104 / FH 1290) TaxID=566461 RepID=D5ZYT2_STRV1|nr:predicted protein [Streptomyces viridosporus ATCC 14672]